METTGTVQQDGYEIRTVLLDDGTTTMEAAFAPDGDYIGTPEDAHKIVTERGIAPVAASPGETCCIGFCEREQRWFGWSHRAMTAYGIGDTIFADDILHLDYPDRYPAATTLGSLDACRQAAVDFAESVG